jgi:hypothetical protein
MLLAKDEDGFQGGSEIEKFSILPRDIFVHPGREHCSKVDKPCKTSCTFTYYS